MSTYVQGRAGWGVLGATILGSGMAFIDTSVVNVALPTLQEKLGATAAAVQWVMNGYTLLLAALILVGGAAGDKFGRRRVFMLGVLVFAVASAACGAAPDPATLIAARAVQGVGGAMMVPGSLALISACFAGEARGRAIGTWAGAAALTTALGPPLGGWLVAAWSWRLVFWINLPLAAITLLLAWRTVPESRDPNAGPLDWQGGLLATLGLGAVSFGAVSAGKTAPPLPLVAAALAFGGVLLAAFVWREARAPAPLVPLNLFRVAAFAGANAATLLLYAALSGALFLLPFLFMQVRGMNAAATGLAFLPLTLIIGLFSRAAGGLGRMTGPALPMLLGPILTALGFAWLALTGADPSPFYRAVLPGLVLVGAGMTIVITPLTTVVMDSVAEDHAGAASGVNNAVARVAGLLAVAALGAAVLAWQREELAARLWNAPETTRSAALSAPPGFGTLHLPPDLPEDERRTAEWTVHAAFAGAFRSGTLACAALAAVAGIVAAVTMRRLPAKV